jgi:diguanylate cyclase (GGDEF)-like protein/PAS domain S-box-containing protein
MSPFHDPEILRSILESLPVGLCVVDMEKRIVLWSDGAERMTGHRRHEVIGHSCEVEPILNCDQAACGFRDSDCPIARAMKTSRLTEAIGFLHHKAGHEVPVNIRAVPVHNARGSIIGAIGTFEDQQPASSADHHEDGLQMPGLVDGATGLPSQLMMQSHLREAIGTFDEIHVPFAVLGFRLDGFDHFRSSYGSEAANSLLRVVGRTLAGALWKTDFIGRWGEDEFLVILNGCREEALRSVCDRIRGMLANDRIVWWGEPRSLPVLIGQATAQPGDNVGALIGRMHTTIAAVPSSPTGTAGVAGGA